MKNFRYFSPRSLGEVISLFQEFRGKKIYIMAGGTDLLIRLKSGDINPDCIIDLKGIPGLSSIEYQGRAELNVGALTSIADIEKNFSVSKEYGALREAALTIGSAQIRNKGTIGGNLCSASPSADLAPPLMVMNAKVRTFSKTGKREFSMEDFFIAPGKTAMREAEIMIEVLLPRLSLRSDSTYLKFSRRSGMDLAIVGVACLLAIKDKDICEFARIAMGAVGPTPLRAKAAETLIAGKRIGGKLIEEVGKVASEEAKPISDIRATAGFRTEIIRVLTKRAISITMAKIESKSN